MSDVSSRAQVLRALTSDHQIRFAALNAEPLWDAVRRGHPYLEAEACACLVELLSATLLLQSRVFFSERLQLMIRGLGKAKVVMADSWPEGDIRGVLDLAENPDFGAWIQGPGLFRVMRSNPKGQPYIGTLELVEGPIQAQIEAYLLHSEQIQASVTLWCDPGTGESGGLLVEPLPNCPHERLGRLVHAIEGLDVVPYWERQPEFLSRWVNQGEGAEILSMNEIQYGCRCNREALIETLQGFEAVKLDDLFPDQGPAEIRCDYCAKTYRISRSEVPFRERDCHAES